MSNYKSLVADKGKWAEKEVRDWLSHRSDTDSRFAWHRYPDSRSARGALAAQPADMLCAYRREHSILGCAWHLEVKETKQLTKLPKTKVTQLGALRKFYWAGLSAFVLVYRSVHNNWIVLGPDTLFEVNESPSFDMTSKVTYTTAALALESILA